MDQLLWGDQNYNLNVGLWCFLLLHVSLCLVHWSHWQMFRFIVKSVSFCVHSFDLVHQNSSQKQSNYNYHSFLSCDWCHWSEKKHFPFRIEMFQQNKQIFKAKTRNKHASKCICICNNHEMKRINIKTILCWLIFKSP